MKIAVNGANGRLGFELVRQGCTPLYADILSPREVKEELAKVNPDVIIHCAGFTDVDACERDSLKKAYQVNVIGTNIVRSNFTGRMIYISTDYVFNGRKGNYKENSEPSPISRYGQTKLEGERIIEDHRYASDVIVRTTILYGSPRKPDFVTAVLEKLSKEESFEVTTSTSGNPTHVKHLAEALIEVSNRLDIPKIINIAGDEILSRYEFALTIANTFDYDPRFVIPTKKEFGEAKRPHNAGLNVSLAKKLDLPIYSVFDGLMLMKNA